MEDEEPPGRPTAAVPASGLAAPVVADIAHDLRNLLTALGHGCETALATLPEASDARAELAAMQATAARAAALAASLMRLALGEAAAAPTVVAVDAALARLRPALAGVVGRGITLEIEAAGAGAGVRIDADAFDRLILNLAANAADAMAGRGRLAIRTETVGGDDGGRRLRLVVTDSGPGIAEAVRARLFEGGVSTKATPQAAGRGRGLAIVRGIVEAAGGRIAAETASAGGARFVIELPVAGEAPGSAGPPAAPATILLVEDSEAVRGLAARALAAAGHRVIAAASGEEALNRAGREPGGIGLVIADLRLPGIDGRELALALRRTAPGLPVILVSGLAAAAIPGDATAAGMRFLEKPYTLKDLHTAVAAALAGR